MTQKNSLTNELNYSLTDYLIPQIKKMNQSGTNKIRYFITGRLNGSKEGVWGGGLIRDTSLGRSGINCIHKVYFNYSIAYKHGYCTLQLTTLKKVS